MDGTAIEERLHKAIAEAAKAQLRMVQATEFCCVAGMRTSLEIQEFQVALQLSVFDLESASIALKAILKMYAEAKP